MTLLYNDSAENPMIKDSMPELNRLFIEVYGRPHKNEAEMPDELLVEILRSGNPLEKSLEVLVHETSATGVLSSRQLGLIKTATEIIFDFFDRAEIHSDLVVQLKSSCAPLVAQLFSDNVWLGPSKNPLMPHLNDVARVSRGWSPMLPQAKQVADALKGALSGYDKRSLKKSIKDYSQWKVDFFSRTEKLEQRVIQRVSGASLSQYARSLSARTINRQVAGRELPEFMAESLSLFWQPAFQWILLDRGEKTPLWHRLVRVFSLLVWSFQKNSSEHKQKFQRVITELKDDLPSLFEQIISDESSRIAMLENIEAAHLNILCEKDVKYICYSPIEGSDALDKVDAEVSADLLEEISVISSKQWFDLIDSGERARLLQRNNVYQRLLFVNQAGIELLNCSFEDFAFRYSSGAISLIPDLSSIADMVQQKLQSLVQSYNQKKDAKDKETYRQMRFEKFEKMAQRQAREDALKQAKNIEIQMREAVGLVESLKSEQATMESVCREDTAGQFGEGEQQRRLRAKLMISTMVVGAWLRFDSGQKESVRRKLLVVLSSSDQYIFVDRDGGDKLQLSRTEMIEGIVDGSIKPLHCDEKFDDALSRVMKGLNQGPA